MTRIDKREPNQLRNVVISKDFLKYADGSVLIEFGDTKVLCSAILEERVPYHLKGSGSGWVTAEYSMLPGSSSSRIKREAYGKIKGRTQEIQRLIGRSLRAVCDLKKLGERTILIDADVIQADGGTRCASITGAFVALKLAVKKLIEDGVLDDDPVDSYLAAVSVGVVSGSELVDLNYHEDFRAELDMNLVANEKGDLVEVQATAEGLPFSPETLSSLVKKGSAAISDLIKIQRGVLGNE
ncbi:MAG: ribonuclease PH [Candidatus Saganbacteria bacterium]|nr:ribonuclease PH [Candidatus Saganbacteria bacterium]